MSSSTMDATSAVQNMTSSPVPDELFSTELDSEDLDILSSGLVTYQIGMAIHKYWILLIVPTGIVSCYQYLMLLQQKFRNVSFYFPGWRGHIRAGRGFLNSGIAKTDKLYIN